MRALGPYVLEKELGRGAAGAVFLARHRATGATRAVKVLEATDPEAVVRFEREAAALGRLRTAGVVAVHELLRDGRRIALVLDLMVGSLRDQLRERGNLPWPEAVALAATLARTLERCHAAGLVHRDLKPGNVLFDEQGAPRLADFGIVRDLAASALTASGTSLGTVPYMAPEQLDGESAGAAADLWALAVLLHECVSGSRPFLGNGVPGLVMAIRRGGRPSLAAVGLAPASLDALLDRALAWDPEHRFSSAAELAAALEGLAAEPATPVARTRRAWASATGLALASAAAVAAAFALATRGSTARGTAPAASASPERERTERPTTSPSGEPRHDDAVITPRSLGPLLDACRDDRQRERVARHALEAENRRTLLAGPEVGAALAAAKRAAEAHPQVAPLQLLAAELALASGEPGERQVAAERLERSTRARGTDAERARAQKLRDGLTAADAVAAALLDFIQDYGGTLNHDELRGRGAALVGALSGSGLDAEAARQVVLAPIHQLLRTCSRGRGVVSRLRDDEFGPALAPLEEILPLSSEGGAVVALFRYDLVRPGIPERRSATGVERALTAARPRLGEDPVLAAALLRRAAQDSADLLREGSPPTDTALDGIVDSGEAAAAHAWDALAAPSAGGDREARAREVRLVHLEALAVVREASWLEAERATRATTPDGRRRHVDRAARLLRGALDRTNLFADLGPEDDARGLVTLGFLFERPNLIDEGASAGGDGVSVLAQVWRAYRERSAGRERAAELERVASRTTNARTLAEIKVLHALVDPSREHVQAALESRGDLDHWLVGGLLKSAVLKELEAPPSR